MKRKYKLIISAIAIVMIAAICVATLAACDKTDTKAIDELYDKLTSSDSLTMEISVSSMSITMKVDADKIYSCYRSQSGTQENYTATIEGMVYYYFTDGETWYKDEGTPIEEIDDELTAISVKSVKDMLRGDNYDYNKSEKTFVHKSPSSVVVGTLEGVTFNTVKLKLEDARCIISLDTAIDGVDTTAILTLSDIGSTSVTLPQAETITGGNSGSEDIHDGTEIDDILSAMIADNNYETQVMLTLDEQEVIDLRYLSDGDKYMEISPYFDDPAYYHIEVEGQIETIYQYVKVDGNYQKSEAIGLGFLVGLDDLTDMLDYTKYEWSDDEGVYKLISGQSFLVRGYTITAATVIVKPDGTCSIMFKRTDKHVDYYIQVINIGETHVTLPTV